MKVEAVCKLIDMLKHLGIIDEVQWLDAHELKWTILGKPGWVTPRVR